MRRPRSSGAPRWVATAWWLSLFSAACLLAVAGCRDRGLVPTGPLPPSSPVLDQSLDSPSSAEAEFVVADEAPLAGAERDLGRFPTPTVVRMAVHQSFTVTPVDPTEGAGAMGLAGRVSGFGCSHQGEAYLVNFPAEGGYGFPFAGCQLAGSEVPVTSFSDIVMVSGLVRFGYSFDAACPYPNQSCARYAGTSGVALERLRATMAIGGDSVRGGELRARTGREYVLRAEATPDRMGRFATPILPVGSAWHFAPDSGPARPDVCDNGSGRTCTMTFDRSGSLTLTALVNGEETVSAPLRVQLPALSMTVSADTVSVGDTVQVTTTVSGLDSTGLSYYAVTTYGPKGEQLDFAYDRVAGTEAPLSVTHPDPAAPGVGGAAGSGVKARAPAARSVAPTSATGAMAAAGSMARASGSLVPEPASRSVGDAGSGGLPPCLRTRPVPTRCYVVLGVAGRARIEVGAFLDRFGASARATQDVVVRGGAPAITITAAGGPNDGSFLTRAPENVIRLQARIEPPDLGSLVKWSITDDPSDEIAAVPPSNVADGATSSFVVSRENERRDRWPRKHAVSGSLPALVIEARAWSDWNGKRYEAGAIKIRQDETDVLRQEYIDFKVPQGIIPARRALSSHAYNGGDYKIAVTNTEFDTRLRSLEAAWSPHRFVVNGIFRNPVHNALHVAAGKSSGTVSASWHQYGCAADLQTYPIVNASSSAESIAAARAFWDGLRTEAILLGFSVEQRDHNPTRPAQPHSGVGHVHIELKCRG